MSAASWRQVALLPVRLACRRTQWLGSAGLLFGTLGTPWVLRAFGLDRIADKLAPVLLGTLILVAWCGYVGALLRQNEPNAARLVPGQVRRLQQVLLGAWVSTTLLTAALGWALFGFGLPALLTAALALIALAWTVRQPALWSVLWVLPAFAWWWTELEPVRWATRQWWWLADAQPLIAILLTLLLAVLLLPAAVQTGGRRHLHSYGRREASRRAAAINGGANPWRSGAGWMAWLQRQTSRPYRAWMAFLCARPPRSPMARAMLGLGPSAHWTSQAAVALVIAAVALGSLALLITLVPAFERSYLLGPALGLMSFAVSPVLQARTSLHQSRREQALLVLLPGVPRGAALNLALARRLSAHQFIAWALGSAVAMALTHGVASATLVVHSVVFVSLPFVLLVWRDWSSTSPLSAGGTAWVVLTMVAGMLCLIALRRADLVGGEVVVLVSVGLTLGVGAWRHAVLARAPAAWPAGRTGA